MSCTQRTTRASIFTIRSGRICVSGYVSCSSIVSIECTHNAQPDEDALLCHAGQASPSYNSDLAFDLSDAIDPDVFVDYSALGSDSNCTSPGELLDPPALYTPSTVSTTTPPWNDVSELSIKTPDSGQDALLCHSLSPVTFVALLVTHETDGFMSESFESPCADPGALCTIPSTHDNLIPETVTEETTYEAKDTMAFDGDDSTSYVDGNRERASKRSEHQHADLQSQVRRSTRILAYSLEMDTVNTITTASLPLRGSRKRDVFPSIPDLSSPSLPLCVTNSPTPSKKRARSDDMPEPVPKKHKAAPRPTKRVDSDNHRSSSRRMTVGLKKKKPQNRSGAWLVAVYVSISIHRRRAVNLWRSIF